MQISIFEEVKKLNFPFGNYAVIGGGVMEAHGIRNHGDVDIIVTREFFEKLKNDGWKLVQGKNNILKKGNYEVDADYRYGKYQPNQKELIKNAEIINDFPFIKLEELIKFKQALDRDKDKKDIELINNYLANKAI
jgi:hypothetical protein